MADGYHRICTVCYFDESAAGWTIERIRADARLIGSATAALCELILETRPHPEQGFRACLGIVRLAGPYGAERLEAAAERAIDIGARTYGSVKSVHGACGPSNSNAICCLSSTTCRGSSM